MSGPQIRACGSSRRPVTLSSDGQGRVSVRCSAPGDGGRRMDAARLVAEAERVMPGAPQPEDVIGGGMAGASDRWSGGRQPAQAAALGPAPQARGGGRLGLTELGGAGGWAGPAPRPGRARGRRGRRG